MRDRFNPNCPSSHALGGGTAGQIYLGRDSTRDTGGTEGPQRPTFLDSPRLMGGTSIGTHPGQPCPSGSPDRRGPVQRRRPVNGGLLMTRHSARNARSWLSISWRCAQQRDAPCGRCRWPTAACSTAGRGGTAGKSTLPISARARRRSERRSKRRGGE